MPAAWRPQSTAHLIPGSLVRGGKFALGDDLFTRKTDAAFLAPVGDEVATPVVPVDAEPGDGGDKRGAAAVVEVGDTPVLTVYVGPGPACAAADAEGHFMVDDPAVGGRGAGGEEEREGEGLERRELHSL